MDMTTEIPMELRISVRVADQRDHRHLLTTMRLANQRSSEIRLMESPLPEADIVIVRRGEDGSAALLRACATTNRPVAVIYATSENEDGDWTLRWPARTADLIPLAAAIGRHLAVVEHQAAKERPAAR